VTGKEDLAKRIGVRIREIRQKNGLNLKQLAQETEISSPFLSRVERGYTMPSIPTLQAIADVLRVDIESLFRKQGEEERGYTISRSKNRRTELSSRGPNRKINYQVELLAKDMDNHWMDPAIVTTLPKTQEENVEPAVHGGQEFCYVLEGVLELCLGDKKIIMRKGDAAYYLGDIPHKAVSLSKRPAKTLNVHLIPGQRFGTWQTGKSAASKQATGKMSRKKK
jgi:transcriptional regulator with XRE-family HTH domain